MSALTCALVVGLSNAEHARMYFLWLALVPGLVGLMHGLMPAALATTCWGIAMLVADQAAAEQLPAMLPVGAAALLAGQSRDHWRRTRAALRQQKEEQAAQLEQLFRAYSLLRASHAQLQERLAAETWSLESAVNEAEAQIAARDAAGAASCLLELLATQARVGAASVYLSVNGELPTLPSARLGAASGADNRHLLVRTAWTRGTLVSVDRAANVDLAHEQPVLVALPIVSSSGQKLGVVAIHELPFVAFHEAHFTLLSTLVARLADALAPKLVVDAVPAKRKSTFSGSLRSRRLGRAEHAQPDCVSS